MKHNLRIFSDYFVLKILGYLHWVDSFSHWPCALWDWLLVVHTHDYYILVVGLHDDQKIGNSGSELFL